MNANLNMIENARRYFEENPADFIEAIEALDSYNGYLDDARWIPMEEFDDVMNGVAPWEVARACFYGDFRPCDDFFRFNGYGNIETADTINYDGYLDDYFVEACFENLDALDGTEAHGVLQDIIEEEENR